MRFAVLITLRNAAPFVDLCLDSLLRQKHEDWQAIVVDDASDDGSYDVINRTVDGDKRVTVIRNEERRGKVRNFLDVLPHFAGDVFLELDGDDWLSAPHALSLIDAAYTRPEVDATSGRAVCLLSKEEPRIIDYPSCHRYALTTATPVSPRTTRLSLVRDFVSDFPHVFIDPKTSRYWDAWGDVLLSAPAMLLARTIFPIRSDVIYTINEGHPNRDCRIAPDFDRLARDTFAACIALEQSLQGPIDWENHVV